MDRPEQVIERSHSMMIASYWLSRCGVRQSEGPASPPAALGVGTWKAAYDCFFDAIPFEKQVIIEARKRPDFILPSLKFINAKKPEAETGLILSAKTTLRERWKQVEREKGKRALFLTTVDENIAGNAIEDMASFGVHLVIPESLKDSKEAEYKGHKNVLSFREFCDNVIQPRIEAWA